MSLETLVDVWMQSLPELSLHGKVLENFFLYWPTKQYLRGIEVMCSLHASDLSCSTLVKPGLWLSRISGDCTTLTMQWWDGCAGKKISDRVRLASMHQEIGISSLETCLRIRQLRWFGHIERQPADAWPNAVRHLVVPGTAPRGRPKKRWQDCVNEDLRALKLKKEDAMERDKWRRLIRSQPKASNPQGWGTSDGKPCSEWVSENVCYKMLIK